MKIDTGSEFGGRAARRLRNDMIYWLVTIGADGTPQPSPVWALWDDDGTFLIYSQADTPKLTNVAARPRVALHLDGDGRGGDIVIVTGDARIDPAAPPADRLPAYVTKYREGMRRIGMTPESFARTYSVALRITPGRLRGH
jgi:PPOX class probable F420-dependent enzyme